MWQWPSIAGGGGGWSCCTKHLSPFPLQIYTHTLMHQMVQVLASCRFLWGPVKARPVGVCGYGCGFGCGCEVGWGAVRLFSVDKGDGVNLPPTVAVTGTYVGLQQRGMHPAAVAGFMQTQQHLILSTRPHTNAPMPHQGTRHS